MNIGRKLLWFSPLLLAVVVGSGCATAALWQDGYLEGWNEPAADPNIRLYAAGEHTNLLVVYDEYSERSDATRTRAYWLNQNEKRLAQRRVPYFVSTNTALNLSAVPVLKESPEGMNAHSIYALLESNRQSFTVYSEARGQRVHDLPVYNDGTGKVEKAALTPLTVTADLTIVGGFIGYFWLQGFAQSDGDISFH